jgi:hypothetical protein
MTSPVTLGAAYFDAMYQRALAARPGLARLVLHAEPDFLAEVYVRTEGAPVSVAQATGLA